MRKTTLLVLLPLACVTACDSFTEPEPLRVGTVQLGLGEGANDIIVMTQNLYHGADIGRIAQVPASEVPFVAAEAWATIQATNFFARAQALADEIAAASPHLIGLQEVTTWRTQTPGDFVLGVRTPNATTIAYDFLAILLAALAERGLDYQVAVVAPTSDLEVPAYTGIGTPPFMDIRYGDADAVLVRADVDVLESFTQLYTVGSGGRKNGWAAARVRVGKSELTFATTHLMNSSRPLIQLQQASEFLAWAALQPVPLIAVGDFNSAANPGAPEVENTDTYRMLLDAGFTDVWDRGNKAEAGLTCCHNESLSNEVPAFDHRIDLILLDQGLERMVGAAQTRVIGADPAVHAAFGLWPSNHAGVLAVLHIPMAQ